MTRLEIWKKTVFTDNELKRIMKFNRKDRKHPLQRLITETSPGGNLVRENTLECIHLVNEKDPNWLKNLKSRLLNSKDFHHSSSALAEIRAYGSLIASGVEIEPVKTNSSSAPEFHCKVDGIDFIVEVFSKQSEENESKALHSFLKPKESDQKSLRYHEHAPFGKPNNDSKKPEDKESVTSISIKGIMNIKQKEHQFDAEKINILWIDFQDETWNTVFPAENAKSYHSFREEITSGALWYAFYGWKGAPIFEAHSKKDSDFAVFSLKPLEMKYDGRFRKATKITSVIISLAKTNIIYENPFGHKLLPENLKNNLSLIPNYSEELSLLSINNKDIKSQIENEKKELIAMQEEYLFSMVRAYY